MALKSSVKMLVRFDQGSLTESVSGETLSVVGSGFANIAANGDGYKMRRDQFLLKGGISLSLTNSLLIGFYLNPKNEGRVPNGSSTNPVKVSVLDLGVGSGSGEDFVMSRNIVVIQEECNEDVTTNKMRIKFYDGSGVYASDELTTSYEAGKRHQFLIVYNGAGSSSVYIDGVLDSSTSSGSLPATIATTEAACTVNRYALSDNDLINSESRIDEIFVTNDHTLATDPDLVESLINNSVDHFLDTDFASVVENDFGLFFDDPSPVRVNASIKDGSSIIAARTDGVLAAGSMLLWESRRDFADDKEIESLTETGNTVEQEKRLLKLDDMVQL